MKLSHRFSQVAALLFLVGIQLCLVNGKETMGDRAKSIREKRLAKARAPRLETRQSYGTEMRYLNNKTERKSKLLMQLHCADTGDSIQGRCATRH